MPLLYWNDTAQDPDRCRRRNAEFLVYSSLPWTAVEQIVVIDATIATTVRGILIGLAHQPLVNVRPGWYY